MELFLKLLVFDKVSTLQCRANDSRITKRRQLIYGSRSNVARDVPRNKTVSRPGAERNKGTIRLFMQYALPPGAQLRRALLNINLTRGVHYPLADSRARKIQHEKLRIDIYVTSAKLSFFFRAARTVAIKQRFDSRRAMIFFADITNIYLCTRGRILSSFLIACPAEQNLRRVLFSQMLVVFLQMFMFHLRQRYS